MSRIAIIHFAPLELYPPVQNLLREMKKRSSTDKVFVFTTSTRLNGLSLIKSTSDKISIIRLGWSGQLMPALRRYANYLYFNIACLILLIIKRPERILYFETISAFPTYLYKRFLKPKTEIYIHYHEYTSPKEYMTGMRLTNYFHRLEKWIIPRAVWVSHTNEFRMDLFRKDLLPIRGFKEFILPNYPPRQWLEAGKSIIILPVRIVYIGSISLSTMYIKEFVEWVVAQKGRATWDIYTHNCSAEVKNYISQLNFQKIHLKEGVNYEELPAILKNYDIGVVLYKGHIPNYIYNAPNKLFEYLACGLDVWFSDVMTGSLKLITSKVFPKVMAIDFTNLLNFDLVKAIDRNEYGHHQSTFYCEEVLHTLINKILPSNER